MMISTQINETALVNQAQNGDRNAYGELVRTHSRGVLNVVYRMCGNKHLAEDAAQEAFIQAWLKLSSYQPRASFRSWLYRIAVNSAIDMLRKEKRILPDAVEDYFLMDPSPGPESMLASTERAELVRKAIVTLPDASRAVLVLREYEGLSYQEIAEAIDIPIGTVMSRLNYARKLLKEKLEMHLFSFAEAEHV
ncbi:MAG: sigma-70 family RNA polymerase sigma factor [Anaerolineae bacterium]|nr:sigma-70 family RNA polymerase sigma factor [Anaerolineae bacterium]